MCAGVQIKIQVYSKGTEQMKRTFSKIEINKMIFLNSQCLGEVWWQVEGDGTAAIVGLGEGR